MFCAMNFFYNENAYFFTIIFFTNLTVKFGLLKISLYKEMENYIV